MYKKRSRRKIKSSYVCDAGRGNGLNNEVNEHE